MSGSRSEVKPAGSAHDAGIVLGVVGDVFVQRDDPASGFIDVAPIFDACDILLGNCEAVYTDRPEQPPSPVAARLIAAPAMVGGLASAGFDVMSLANNHMMDAGVSGMADTCKALDAHGIAHSGAGGDIAEARRHAIIRHQGRSVAFLSYTAVYGRGYAAGRSTPGIAPMRTHTVYEPESDYPGGTPRTHIFVDHGDLSVLRHDVEAARAEADFVVISLHQGMVEPFIVADYERTLVRAAVEAGVDAVFATHHHLLRGIEFIRGTPVFYGLSHFHFDMRWTSLIQEGWGEWMEARYGEWGIFPREGYPLLPFHPDARMTMIAVSRLRPGQPAEAGFIPCVIHPDGRPSPLAPDSDMGRQVIDYVIRCNEEAGLKATFGGGDGWLLGGFPVLRVTPAADTVRPAWTRAAR